eukprot:scaffold53366_cov36-Cyclotella_meneghiniana.AAC.1
MRYIYPRIGSQSFTQHEVRKHFTYVHVSLEVPSHQTPNHVKYNGKTKMRGEQAVVDAGRGAIVNHTYVRFSFQNVEPVHKG